MHPILAFGRAGGSFGFVGLFALLALGFFGLWLWALIDCATKEPAEGNDKVVWILVIVLASWIGALVYLLVRRPARIREHGR
jgi:hypothetical protein